MDEETHVRGFQLFSRKNKSIPATAVIKIPPPASAVPKVVDPSQTRVHDTFSELGLSQWVVDTCTELGMKRPTPVQHHCIPKILAGRDVMGLAETGSGKTAAFALPILNCLAQNPFGVFALVITPTRELAYQLADQFRALGSVLGLRCAVIVGGMDTINQSQCLTHRPHVVIATPGRIKLLIEANPHHIPAVFSNTKFLVLDEADRVLCVNFEEELRVIFRCLPKKRQTLLFTATMTSNLKTLFELSCELLSLLLEQLDLHVASLHSFKSQSLRLSALHKFKSGQVPVLISTDVANRGLDIPTVDLVLNYDIPRYPEDYVHRVGRTARAGREGLALSFITQNDVDLVHEIETFTGKKLDKFECKEKEVLEDNITKVYKARRVATMKMMDDGFDEVSKVRKAQKWKLFEEKILQKKRKRSTPVKSN